MLKLTVLFEHSGGGGKFVETVKHVEEHLILLEMKSRNVSRERRNQMYGVWEEDSWYVPVSDQSEDSEDSTSEEGSFDKLREQNETLYSL